MLGILRSPLFPICLTAIGAFLLYSGHENAAKFAALRDHGKTATAKVTELEWMEKKYGHSDGAYIAHIRFTTDDKRDIQTTLNVPISVGQALRGKINHPGGGTITVRYLPESPETLADITRDDASDAEQGIGRYMLFGGLAWLALRAFLSRSMARAEAKARRR